MASTALLLLALSSFPSLTVAVLFGEPRIYGEDATGYGPIFEEETVDVVYIEDSPDGRISMNCRARANPPATYRWRRDNWEIKLMEQPDEHYSLVGGNLVITNPIQKKHAGTYVCVARNIYGTVISKEARVKFGWKQPESGSSTVSSTEALVWWLPVVDTGTGLQQYIEGYQVRYWRKYDDPEPGANRIFVLASVQTRLENMLPDSHYLIEVRAYNGAGLGPPREMCEMFTKRPPPPDPPRMWRYISWTGKWLYVWWDHIQYDWFGNISFPLYYKVMFRKSGYIYGKVYITGWHFMDFPMPQVEDYELMVCGRYEGGDGPVRRIKILGHASTITPTLSLVSLVLLALCVVGLEI